MISFSVGPFHSLTRFLRRIERLIVTETNVKEGGGTLPPLTSGLLLISVSHLRSYAERYLPARSLFREGFLDDVADLENPELGKLEKQRILDRMWRSWGDILGWTTIGRN